MRLTPALLLFLFSLPAVAGLKRAGDMEKYPCPTEIPASCHKLMKPDEPKKLGELLKEEKFDYEAFSLYTGQMRSACQSYMLNPEQEGTNLSQFKDSAANARRHYSSYFDRFEKLKKPSKQLLDAAKEKNEAACYKAFRLDVFNCRTDAFWKMRVTMQNGLQCGLPSQEVLRALQPGDPAQLKNGKESMPKK